jgi:hypothetical protein
LRAGNFTPSRYLPTWAGSRFLKKSTGLRLLLADRWPDCTALPPSQRNWTSCDVCVIDLIDGERDVYSDTCEEVYQTESMPQE